MHRTALLAALTMVACGPPVASLPSSSAPAPLETTKPAAVTPTTEEIAKLHHARCGICHVRVEPGTRARDVLSAALLRHRTRTHLSEPQWAALLEYLAKPSS